MKNIDKKYIHIGIVAFLVAAATITFAFILFHPTTVIGLWKNFVNSSSPILWGLILGYLLAPVCNCIEGGLFWLYKRTSKLDLTKSNVRKRTRKMAIAITMLLTLWVLYVFFSVIIQEMVVSIQSIVAQSSVYADNLQHFAEKILASNANLQSTVEELVETFSDSFET